MSPLLLSKAWLSLQTLSLLVVSSALFASSPGPIAAVAFSSARSRRRRIAPHDGNIEGNRITMRHHRDRGPAAAFHSRHRHCGQREKLLPLEMIPGSQYYGTSSNFDDDSRPASFVLDAAKPRGGGGDGEMASTPSTTAGDGTEDSSSIVSRAAAMAGAVVESVATSKKARGRATLLLVAFLYGTLNVTLRAIYATDGPPAASVLSLVRQVLSIASFVPIFAAARAGNQDVGSESEERRVQPLDGAEVRPMWMSALELAFWNFGAQGLINAGLLSSPAARASFLTQTSVVMTPLISAFAGESIKSSVWGGCGLALFGLFLISTSTTTGDVDAAASTFNQGDAMILLGALSWSTYIFRTSKLAKSYSELNLQFTKTALLAVMYGGWFLTTAASALASAGTSFLSPGWTTALAPLWSGWNSPIVWLLLAYSAVGPGAVADLLQQRGQRETSASESNVILCMESVFAAACTFVLLGEVSSMQEMAGGILIVVAAIIASK